MKKVLTKSERFYELMKEYRKATFEKKWPLVEKLQIEIDKLSTDLGLL